MDYGAIQTDKELKKLEKKLTESYKTANKYVTKKLKEKLKKFEKKDKEALKQVKKGILTQSEYLDWRSKYLIPQNYLKDLQEVLATDMSNANQIATAMINNEMPDIFAMNANYATYEVDKLLGLEASSSFSLYDHDTVVRLMGENPEIIPEAKVNIPRDKRWNRNKIHSAITQGILTGDSIPHIADRLMKVTDMNRKAAIRNARTYTTAAQNGGRVDGYKRAKEMGIEIKQAWMAALDMRTRTSHRHLDGEKIEVGEKFSNGLRYPGDPEGRPEEVYNCRCTLFAVDPMFEKEDEELMKHRWSKLPEGMSYEEWKGLKIENEDFASKIRKIAEGAPDIDEATIKKAGKVFADALEKEYLAPLKEEVEKTKKNFEEWEKKAEKTIQEMHKLSREEDDLYWVLKGIDPPENYGLKTIEEAKERHDWLKKRMDQLRESEELKKRNEYALAYNKALSKRDDPTACQEWMKRKIGLIRDVGVGDVDVAGHLRNSRSPMRKHVEYAYDHYPTEWVLRSANKGKLLVKKASRGYYMDDVEIVLSGSDVYDYRETAFHELGHRFEHTVPKIRELERAFYKRRTDGEELKWLGRGYAKSEKTRRDNFLSDYMGKDYGGNAFELVSMGFQYAFNDPVRLAKDKDMQEWILGMLLLV